ncbi:ComEC/Rec2 family competence protein [Phaeocystidibacter marisrubri]|uniref:Uncharacterized protein n=1 Tax=Phaeocystidibacter marisrubri TaxID=1577780 RepID=A0A6L3ZHV9_9FLAO|nr:hypothetical protein [Phaeocystidibacter marisrubri]KAB2816599.1 hypothetical protein F8C82_13030 [Phaeocystidibacter marisrubri]GGH69863.1 hypothetical protein GCM10011318_11330 [Phaeocystidibacter marisrubri]
MARGNMIVSVVDVGQGQCTFVEIYNSANTKIVETLLFDCGTDHPSAETQNNLQYIADRVELMDTPTIDCIFFSHSDNDHVSLTMDLLKKFTTKPAVGEVWYGGEYSLYKKGKKDNVLDYLVDNHYCTINDIQTPDADCTDYSKKRKAYEYYLWESSDHSVKVHLLGGNVLDGKLSTDPGTSPPPKKRLRYAEPKNRVSLVCGLYYAGTSYVICGDATFKTMAAIAKVFEGGTSVFGSNFMTTLPHHGSRTTGFAVSSTKSASPKNKAIVKAFADIVNSMTISISAYSMHSHPSMELMNTFLPTIGTPVLKDKRLKGKNLHHLNGYLDLDLTFPTGLRPIKTYHIFESQSNTYSTQYSNFSSLFSKKARFKYNLGGSSAQKADGPIDSTTPLNKFACWTFEIDTSGSSNSLEIGGYTRLGGTLFTGPTTTSKASILSAEEKGEQMEETIPVTQVRTREREIFRPASSLRTMRYHQQTI